MNKRILALLSCGAMAASLLTGCGGGNQSQPSGSAEPSVSTQEATVLDATTVYVDIAASLTSSFDEIVALYNESQPNVTISLNSGSSGKLMQEIEESAGHGVDIFFSAGKKQVTQLNETDGLVVDGTIVELLQNQLCLVTANGSGTTVTGWEDMSNAANMALCDGSVPVGKYSREALVNLGYLDATDDNSAYTADQVSAALDGIEINECADVAAAAQAVSEQSNEIGTIYYSDWYDYEDSLTILAQDDGTLTGPIIYPVCQIVNADADDAELAATADFLAFLQTPEVQQIFADHCFIING